MSCLDNKFDFGYLTSFDIGGTIAIARKCGRREELGKEIRFELVAIVIYFDIGWLPKARKGFWEE
jgi:hypothetical protein